MKGDVLKALFWVLKASAIAAGITVAPIVFVVLAVVAGSLLGGSYQYEIHPSPDRSMVLVDRVELTGGAAGSMRFDVYLGGGSLSDLTLVGSYSHGWWKPGDGWRDAATVNICDLQGDLAPRTEQISATTVATRNGFKHVRIERTCPR